jgi:molecular chaperone DnaK (HSP70)
VRRSLPARKVEIIVNDQGNRTTPSYVAFTDSDRLIGDAAKNQVCTARYYAIFRGVRETGKRNKDLTFRKLSIYLVIPLFFGTYNDMPMVCNRYRPWFVLLVRPIA